MKWNEFIYNEISTSIIESNRKFTDSRSFLLHVKYTELKLMSYFKRKCVVRLMYYIKGNFLKKIVYVKQCFY